MTASSLQVTPGSGLRLSTDSYTEGGNTVHNQKIIQGLPNMATYLVSTVSVSTATANSHLLQIMAGASLNVYVHRIVAYQIGLATTAALMQWGILRLTTAGTGGTVVGSLALDSTDAAAGAAGMTLPTVKGTETAQPFMFGSAYMMQTAGASAQLTAPLIDADFERLRGKPIRIAAGTSNGVALKNPNTAIAAGTILISAYISEATY